MFETVGFSSLKEKVFKVFRLFRGGGNEHLNGSPGTDVDEDLSQPNSFNLQAYIAAKKRTREIESQKAMLVALSRHDRWKAGGPL